MSDETVIDRMVVQLGGDGASYAKMAKESMETTKKMVASIEGSLKRLGDVGKKVGQGVLGWFGASSLYGFAQKAVRGFGEAEDAAVKLQATLEGNGRNVAALTKQYESFASAIQKVTRVDDDAVISLLQTAETMGLTGEAAMRAAKNAIGLSAARGISTTAAIRMTAALEQGNASMLQRHLPALKKVTEKTAKAALAQKELAKMFGVAKASAQTMPGVMDRFNNAMGNLVEDIGKVLVVFLKPFVDWTMQVADAFREALPAIQAFAEGAAKAMEPVWNNFKTGFAAVFGFFFNFKENSQKLFDWWGANWKQVIQAVGTAFIAGTNVLVNNAWETFAHFARELVIWGSETGMDMATSWGKAFVDRLAYETRKAVINSRKAMGFDVGMDMLDNEATRAKSEKDFESGAYGPDEATKKKRAKEAEERRRFASSRLKSVGNAIASAFDGIKPPDINLQSPMARLAEDTKKAEAEIDKLAPKAEAVKKALPFYGDNEAVRRGTQQYRKAIEDTMKFLHKNDGAAQRALNPSPAKGVAAAKATPKGAGKKGGPNDFTGDERELQKKYGLSDAELLAARAKAKAITGTTSGAAQARRAISGQAAMSTRDRSAQAVSEYDRRSKQAVDRVRGSAQAAQEAHANSVTNAKIGSHRAFIEGQQARARGQSVGEQGARIRAEARLQGTAGESGPSEKDILKEMLRELQATNKRSTIELVASDTVK